MASEKSEEEGSLAQWWWRCLITELGFECYVHWRRAGHMDPPR